MRKGIIILSLLCLYTPVSYGGFLKAQSFPGTFQDLSFSTRMDFKSDDYELYQPEYDENGRCVSGCAYPGLTIDREHQISAADTQAAIQHSEQYQQNQQNNNVQIPVDTQNIITALQTPSVPTQPTNTNTSTAPTPHCINRNTNIPSGQGAPFGKPLKGNPRISSPYGPRVLHGKRSYHDGIDFAVPVGTDVYSPAEAVVVKIINDNRCGKGLRLKHDDGTQSIYCHLSKQLVNQGERVGAGCQIAESGNTGHSTGPHLHYGLRNSAGSKIDPTSYINR